VVAVAHEMARIKYFMLSRNEPYRDADGGLTERKLKGMGKKAFNGCGTEWMLPGHRIVRKRFS
jgi:hypothetical protein